MISSVDIRPEQPLGFFNKIRTNLMITFFAIVGFTILIGILALNNQITSRKATQQLLNIDAPFVQTAFLARSDLGALSKLGGEFIAKVASSNSSDAAFIDYVQPWHKTFQQLKEKVLFDSYSDLSIYDGTTTHVIDEQQLDELEASFIALASSFKQRNELIAQITNLVPSEMPLGIEVPVDFQIAVISLTLKGGDYLRTGDPVYITEYNELTKQIQAGVTASEMDPFIRGIIVSKIDSAGEMLATIHQIDNDLTQQLGAYENALLSVDSSLKTIIDQSVLTLTDQQESIALFNRNTSIAIAISAALTVLIASLYLITKGMRTVKQVCNLEDTIDAVQDGDSQARASIISNNEIGIVADKMNYILNTTFSLLQSQAEQDAIQQAVIQLVEDVGQITEGDLTVQAQELHPLTDGLTLSFNQMIAYLYAIIEQIHSTAFEIDNSADYVSTAVQKLITESDSQATHILDTSFSIEELASSILHISKTSADSKHILEKAFTNANIGVQAIHKTISGMDQIQQGATTTSQQISHLLTTNLAINSSIDQINDIADQTSVLALNATIRSLAAGTAGRGFTIVAREIESLAAQVSQAANRVAQLSNQMQIDAEMTLSELQTTQGHIKSNQHIAENATLQLDETKQIIGDFTTMVNEISSMTQQQVHNSEVIVDSANELTSVTERTKAGTHAAITTVNKLAQFSEGLRESVSLFRLTDNDTNIIAMGD